MLYTVQNWQRTEGEMTLKWAQMTEIKEADSWQNRPNMQSQILAYSTLERGNLWQLGILSTGNLNFCVRYPPCRELWHI